MRAFGSGAVGQAFQAVPAPMRRKLLALRRLILETAAETEGVGPIEETLKWGEPAYLTSQTRSGSPVRLGWKKARPGEYAMYFNCQTTLVETFRTLFPELRFEGNRAIVFQADEPVPRDVLKFCVAATLTYHQRKRRAAAG